MTLLIILIYLENKAKWRRMGGRTEDNHKSLVRGTPLKERTEVKDDGSRIEEADKALPETKAES